MSTASPTTREEAAAIEAASAKALLPKARHDGLAFEDLAQRYNFLEVSSYGCVLANLILKEIMKRSRPVRVLDVGCGKGIGRDVAYQWALRPHIDDYWGIEPDESVASPEGLFDRRLAALMEAADLPEAHFDVVYSSMVMEHVTEPAAFMGAVHRCLKPGGCYVFATPNSANFICLVGIASHKLHLDEPLLLLSKGRQQTEEYHYPVQYRFNNPRAIARCVRALGFAEPEFAFVEGDGSRSYFRGPLRPIYALLKAKRRLIRNPRALATLIGRITRPA
jgi:SAM-dependent methyltransferase